MTEDYKDPEWLHEKYNVEGLTHREMADLVGMNHGTISYWMDKHNIDRPDAGTAKRLVPPKLVTRRDGYEWIGGSVADKQGGLFHPLIAIAEGHDPHKVYAENMVVHHKNGIPWDNRPDNLTVTDRASHAQKHHERGDLDISGLENVQA